MSEKEFKEIIDKFRPKHLWEKRVMNGLSDTLFGSKMKNKLVGTVGLSSDEILKLKKKYKNFSFIKVTDKNIFKESVKLINALLILYEWPVKKNLRHFLSKKNSEFKNLEWLHLSRAGVDEYLPYLKKYNFNLTCGKKIQGPNVSEHCIAMLLTLTRSLIPGRNSNNFSCPTEINGKNVLILGLGGIGLEIAKKLFYFGATIDGISNKNIKKIYK